MSGTIHKKDRERIPAFRRAILRWFRSNGRDLPWRRNTDAWGVLMSEFMLQQTQVDRVIPKFLEFRAKWPTPSSMARSPQSDVVRRWSGLGYNRRAVALHRTAVTITKEHGGDVPDDVTCLEALPGIGRYTARAVASFAFGKHEAACDTNIRRVSLRYFRGGEFSRGEVTTDTLEDLLRAILPRGRSGEWHGALMDFGSAICTGRTPSCGACPLRPSCAAAPKFLAGASPRRRLVRSQPRFEGSNRQLRGAIVRALSDSRTGRVSMSEIMSVTGTDASRALEALEREGVLRAGKRWVTLVRRT